MDFITSIKINMQFLYIIKLPDMGDWYGKDLGIQFQHRKLCNIFALHGIPIKVWRKVHGGTSNY